MHVIMAKDEDVLLVLQLEDASDLLRIGRHVHFVLRVVEGLSEGLETHSQGLLTNPLLACGNVAAPQLAPTSLYPFAR